MCGIASALAVLCLSACTAPKAPADTGAPGGTSGNDSSSADDSAENSTSYEDDATIAVNIKVEIAGAYAESVEGGYAFMGSQDAGPIGIWHVEPGNWWVTAIADDLGIGRCDRSETVKLLAGDSFVWIVSDFPGVFDENGDCVLSH
jgi:hypothetical protein